MADLRLFIDWGMSSVNELSGTEPWELLERNSMMSTDVYSSSKVLSVAEL